MKRVRTNNKQANVFSLCNQTANYQHHRIKEYKLQHTQTHSHMNPQFMLKTCCSKNNFASYNICGKKFFRRVVSPDDISLKGFDF